MLELRYFSICPFGRTIVLLINELKIDIKLIEIKNPADKLVESSRPGIIESPLLVLDTQETISGSNAIGEYIFENSSNARDSLLGFSILERTKARSIWSWIERKFYSEITGPIIKEKILKNFCCTDSSRFPDPGLIKSATIKLKSQFALIQDLLVNHQYCTGDNLSIADFALAANISILDYLGHIYWGNELRRLRCWYSLLKSRPSFRAILAMKVIGFQPTRHYASVDF